MDALTNLYSPSCWVDGLTRDEVMTNFIETCTNCCVNLRNDPAIVREEDIEYSNGLSQKADVWGKVGDKLLIFIHGGYWAAGTRKDCLPPARCVLSTGFSFVSLGYRLAINECSIDHCVDDVICGVRFLLEKYKTCSSVVIGGHSAGAHLAVQVATKIKEPRIKGLLLFSGCYFLDELTGTDIGKDISLTMDQAKRQSCDLSQLNGLEPRTLIILGLDEAPKLIEQNRHYAEQRKKATIKEFSGSSHFTIITNMLDDGSREYKAVKEFLHGF